MEKKTLQDCKNNLMPDITKEQQQKNLENIYVSTKRRAN